MTHSPKYPVYVISKGRSDCCLTSRCLHSDGVEHWVVVEPQEREAYAASVGADRILVLPFSNLGMGSIPSRNWVWEHSISTGAERHWIIDDNISHFGQRISAMRIPCDAGIALSISERFIDRYSNIAIGGLNYEMFIPDRKKHPPFVLNVHVYSCLLILNSLRYRWRGRYNEDTDLCLQVLAGGWCTVLLNAFFIKKMQTMTMRGGNTAELYASNGRLKMARALEHMWPGVVTTRRRFGRAQHSIAFTWKKFDTQLIAKPDVPPVDPFVPVISRVKDVFAGTTIEAIIARHDREGRR